MNKRHTGTRAIDPSLPETLLLDNEARTNEGARDHGQNESCEITGVHLFMMIIMNTESKNGLDSYHIQPLSITKKKIFGDWVLGNWELGLRFQL